jgi:probable rRNA maturation factor
MPLTVQAPEHARRLVAPLTRIVALALAAESARVGEITVVLSDDATLRRLNRRYRRIDRATDVLSFDYQGGGATPALALGASAGVRRPISGDLVISLDRTYAQARRYRVSAGRELARLVVHGALHLAGLDHHRAAERVQMRAREEAALAAARAPIAALERVLGPR